MQKMQLLHMWKAANLINFNMNLGSVIDELTMVDQSGNLAVTIFKDFVNFIEKEEIKESFIKHYYGWCQKGDENHWLKIHIEAMKNKYDIKNTNEPIQFQTFLFIILVHIEAESYISGINALPKTFNVNKMLVFFLDECFKSLEKMDVKDIQNFYKDIVENYLMCDKKFFFCVYFLEQQLILEKTNTKALNELKETGFQTQNMKKIFRFVDIYKLQFNQLWKNYLLLCSLSDPNTNVKFPKLILNHILNFENNIIAKKNYLEISTGLPLIKNLEKTDLYQRIQISPLQDAFFLTSNAKMENAAIYACGSHLDEFTDLTLLISKKSESIQKIFFEKRLLFFITKNSKKEVKVYAILDCEIDYEIGKSDELEPERFLHDECHWDFINNDDILYIKADVYRCFVVTKQGIWLSGDSTYCTTDDNFFAIQEQNFSEHTRILALNLNETITEFCVYDRTHGLDNEDDRRELYFSILVLTSTGRLLVLGNNEHGQLGIKTDENDHGTKIVTENNYFKKNKIKIAKIDSNGESTYIYSEEQHKFYGFGKNSNGRLAIGKNDTDCHNFPQELACLNEIINGFKVRDFKCADNICCVWLEDFMKEWHFIYAWGSEDNPTGIPLELKLPNEEYKKICKIEIKEDCLYVIAETEKNQQSIFAWGINPFGSVDMNQPVIFKTLTQLENETFGKIIDFGVSLFEGGDPANFYLHTDEGIFARGINDKAQLGLGHKNPVDTLTKINFNDCKFNGLFKEHLLQTTFNFFQPIVQQNKHKRSNELTKENGIEYIVKKNKNKN